MVYTRMADPYLCKGLEKNVVGLRNLMHSTMEQVHNQFALYNRDISDDEFQSEVISRVKNFLDRDFFRELDNNVMIWAGAETGIVKQYFKERTETIAPRRFLKVAIKCNSQGDTDEVLLKDLEPWVDSVKGLLKNPLNKKYLDTPATRKQVLATLRNMLAFPVSVKETPVLTHSSEVKYLSEEMIEGLILNEPEKYLPDGALKLLNNGGSITDNLIVSSNVVIYKKNEKGKDYRREGRVKASEALKWAKYIVGIRNEPLYDGIGIMEVVPNIGDIESESLEILLLKGKKTSHRLDHRYPINLSKKPTNQEIRQTYDLSEEAVMQLLKTSYLTKDGEIDEERKDKFKSGLIYGNWIDMNLQSTKGPVEVQVKDALGHMFYTFNSPFGHNSKAYHKVRMDELHKKVKVGNKEYSVDKIAEYIANDVMRPAFTMVGRIDL